MFVNNIYKMRTFLRNVQILYGHEFKGLWSNHYAVPLNHILKVVEVHSNSLMNPSFISHISIETIVKPGAIGATCNDLLCFEYLDGVQAKQYSIRKTISIEPLIKD